jgi:DNA-binding GntR family transcriptional regulator
MLRADRHVADGEMTDPTDAPKPGTTGRSSSPSDGLRNNEYVFRQLKDQIITGVLAPGSRLIESSVAAQFGVSRTPVREALQRLATEDLIDVDPMRGMVVHSPDASEIEDVLVVRGSLDGLAAALAAQKISESQLARLRLVVEAMAEGAAIDKREQIVMANRRFHDIIYAAAGNPRLERIAGELRDYVRRFSTPPSASPERVQHVLAEHRAILDAFERHDPDAARAASDRHLDAAREYVARLALQEFAEHGLR